MGAGAPVAAGVLTAGRVAGVVAVAVGCGGSVFVAGATVGTGRVLVAGATVGTGRVLVTGGTVGVAGTALQADKTINRTRIM